MFHSLRTRPRPRGRIAAAITALAAAGALTLAPAAAHAESSGYSALVSADCTNGRLQLVLDNQSTSSTTFTVTWPGRSGSPWTKTVAAGGNTLMYWTIANGTAYSLTTTTASGWSNLQSGTMACGLATGHPTMNQTTLLTTSTVIDGLNGASGTYDGTVASVRIPALAVTNDGTLVMTADARVSSSGDLPNNIQIVMRRSTDGGTTWTTPTIIEHAPSTTEGTGDSSLLVDRATGRLFCFFNYGPPGIGFNSAASGSNSTSDTKSLHVEYVYSDDDGANWSSAVDLNPSVKDATWGSLFASSGHGIQLSGGRLLQPIVYRDSAGVDHTADIYSVDNGATWHTGGSADTNVNESKVIERSTGTVVQDMRANAGGYRYDASSTNQGTSFGTAVSNGLIDPGCNGDESSYLKPSARNTTTGAPLTTSDALFSNNRSSSSRVNLTVRYSTNDGASWPYAALLVPGTAGYSTLATLNDGTIADLYEVGDTGGVFIDHFTLAWLEAA